MANSNITLHHFDVYGIGEVARLVLAYGQKEYKDLRVAFDEWDAKKPTTPLGQMPVLEMDGECFPQSFAIWNFLAKEFGLYPQSNKDQMLVDIVNSIFRDIMKHQYKWYYFVDYYDEKWTGRAKALQNTEKYLVYLENMIKKNGTGWVVGSTITLADIIIFDMITGYCHHSLDYSPEKYPLIAKNLELVKADPKVGPYIATRVYSIH